MKTKEFITLKVNGDGFVVYGIGAGANRCQYRGGTLMSFLDDLGQKLPRTKDELNNAWELIDKGNADNPRNLPIIQKILATGWWAYSLAIELAPLYQWCSLGPTDPLRSIFIRRLEEIFTKCFACAHIFGSADESMVGLRGLLTDFEANGGIDLGTGRMGYGFHLTIMIDYVAYLAPTNREAIVYQRFGEFMEAITTLVLSRYPKVSLAMAEQLGHLINSRTSGFATSEITSEAKTAMLAKLAGLMADLGNTSKVATKAA